MHCVAGGLDLSWPQVLNSLSEMLLLRMSGGMMPETTGR